MRVVEELEKESDWNEPKLEPYVEPAPWPPVNCVVTSVKVLNVIPPYPVKEILPTAHES